MSLWAKTSPVDLCMQTSVLTTRLYGSQISPVDLRKKNTVLSSRLTSLFGSQQTFVVFTWRTENLGQELQVSMGTRPHLWICACKTASSVSELLVSIGPILTCGFCMQNSDFWTRFTSLYWTQTSPVILCIQNNVISFRNTSLYGSQPSFVFFACKQRL